MENEPKIKPEDLRTEGIPEKELQKVSDVYRNYYIWKARRTGIYLPFQGADLETVLTTSRELFWNSISTKSNDLNNLGMDFSIPFARNEVMEHLGRLASLGVIPKLTGDAVDGITIRVLNGLYKKWEMKSNDKVENFWELLYGIVNGTVCSYIGYNNATLNRRYLKEYNAVDGTYRIENKSEKYYDNVWKEIVPIEDLYVPKIYERDLQKQGALIWKSQIDEAEFHAQFDSLYPNAKYAVPGYRIAEDSLYYRLLGGTGTTSYNKIELIRWYDWFIDEHILLASGVLLNGLGKGSSTEIAPMPFDHKMAPFTLGQMSPQDEKLIYGMPMPWLIKEPNKILNTAFTMAIESELRAIDPPVLSSDIDTPDFIYGQHKTIPVNDINAYKTLPTTEMSGSYQNLMNSLQSNMSLTAQGGEGQAIPSKQPKSAREVVDNQTQQEQTMMNSTLLYYNILRQRILLVIKTALQFYTLAQYENADERVVKEIMVGDMPLTQGGVGDMKIRIVTKTKTNNELFLEGIREAATSGKQTEIIEMPISVIQDLEFDIEGIELVPETSSEVELANWVENVLNPMINVYVPAGVASIDKTFLRHLEKMKESVADFSAPQKPPQVPGQQNQPGQGQPGQASPLPGNPTLSQNGVQQPPQGAVGGNFKSMSQGMRSGMRQNGPLGTPFGSQKAKPLIAK